MKDYILSIDQGTTSTRVIIFDKNFNFKSSSQKELKQIFPRDGEVEHDPEEIYESVLFTAKEAIRKAKIKSSQIRSIGITNQRETTVLWDKTNGKPVYNAIVWQDRRTVKFCKSLVQKGFAKKIQKATGLIVDSYFSASKIHWLLNNSKKAKELLKKDKLLFGTIDTWLLWKLTDGQSHYTEATNASRTMLFDIKKSQWSKDMLQIFKVPKNILPIVKDSADDFGQTTKFGSKIPIQGIAGDQQAATIGQACLEPGSIKSTYGTGCFMIMNVGSKLKYSRNKLLSTIAYRIKGKNTYALEGSIFIAGAAVQWLRDSLKIIQNAKETEGLYSKNDPTQKVYLVPAFVGLGAPYWDGEARGALFGLTRNTGIPELVKATIDSVVYQTKDLILAMEKDSGIRIKKIKVDGGMVNNNQFVQFLSNLLLCECLRPKINETTSLGAAYLAGYQSGLIKKFTDINSKWKSEKTFVHKMNKKDIGQLYLGWKKAIKGTLASK
jgi:glycerol kinase